jgi:hypothetical protein
MSDDELHTYREAATLAGVSYNTFKQHIARGKVKVTQTPGGPKVSDDDLHAYMVETGLEEAVAPRKQRTVVEIAGAVGPSLGVLVGRLPPALQEALLEGMRTGSPEPWRKAKAKWDAEIAGQETVTIGALVRTSRGATAISKTDQGSGQSRKK